MKKGFIIILILGAVVAGWLFKVIFISQSGTAEAKDFAITNGEKTSQISSGLKNAGLIQNEIIFKAILKLKHDESRIMAGTHRIPGNLSVSELINVLVSGSTISNEKSITIPEGWSLRDIAALLIREKIITNDSELYALTGKPAVTSAQNAEFDAFRKKYSIPDGHSLEGFLFPDTYRIFITSSAEDIVKKMLANYETKIESIKEIGNTTGLSDYEVLTLASIVSEEGKTLEDKKMIAGVFLNRLNGKIALRSDATVNYVTEKKVDGASLDDIGIDSPYNTYKYRGLPPGPISNPGLDDIIAVLQATHHDYYYFLSTDDGKIIFAKTFEEHVANRVKYNK